MLAILANADKDPLMVFVAALDDFSVGILSLQFVRHFDGGESHLASTGTDHPQFTGGTFNKR